MSAILLWTIVCKMFEIFMLLFLLMNRLYAISAKLSPEQRSSGIEVLEADSFKLHCFQTHTGKKQCQDNHSQTKAYIYIHTYTSIPLVLNFKFAVFEKQLPYLTEHQYSGCDVYLLVALLLKIITFVDEANEYNHFEPKNIVLQVPVVQIMDNAIHWINHYPVDHVVCCCCCCCCLSTG